ncbi:hypothetical protein G3M48_004811 [Beauveria asiatica]|uniref:Cupin 2 conserved barrel domain-containing protein n=1 Tax=Beauveria asiatica TaxID=1069075 RepID=A0AAW0RSE3_9HYPO
MASLIPFISEILPMIMPASTHVTAAKDLRPAHPTVEGPVIRRAAVVDRCDKMCASVLTTRPRSRTPVRHNSEQGAGDFAFIPAWTEHQIHNDTDDDLVMVVIQSGSRPVGAILTDWGGDEVTADITSD